jgi:hypothetical protein
VYRLSNRFSGDRLYTTLQAEIDAVTGLPGSDYVNEGVAYVTPVNGNQLVYRFARLSSGDHFYTANTLERDALMANPGFGYQYEGPAFNVYGVEAAPAGATSVFRFSNPTTGGHFYTANATEVASVRSGFPGWIFEGLAWYV